MTSLFAFLSRYFWVVAIAVAILNTAILWWRSRAYIRQNPDLASGYAWLIPGYFVGLSLPWFVMGIGIVVGNVPTIWSFLYPRSGNPYVLAWWLVYGLLIILEVGWIVLGGGAAMLAKHPGLLRGNPTNPRTIKLAWLVMLGASVAVMVLMFSFPPSLLPQIR